jgi:hypothetical protein
VVPINLLVEITDNAMWLLFFIKRVTIFPNPYIHRWYIGPSLSNLFHSRLVCLVDAGVGNGALSRLLAD